MRKLIISAVLGLATVTGCSNDKADKASVKDDLPTMTVEEVDKGRAANELTLIDCNGEKTRKQLGIIPDAVLITDEETFAATELPTDKTRKLVFYCSGPG